MRKLLRALVAVLVVCCSTANAQLVDVINEVYSDGVGVANYPAGHTTYRIYARLQDSNDFFSSCYGISDPGMVHLLRIGDTDEAIVNPTTIWNSGFGGTAGPDVNAAFCGFFPELCFDSFITINRASSADPGGPINILTNPAGQLQATFGSTAGAAAAPAMVDDGAWFALNGDSNGLPIGPENRVLLAQVTCPTGTLAYQLNLQIFDAGDGDLQFLYAHTFSGDPTGFVGPYPEIDGTCMGIVFPVPAVCSAAPGCTDPEACNYDPAAAEDDGSCDYSCYGCTDPEACNYSPAATQDNGSCDYSCYGCTDADACNFDSGATIDNGSCTYPGCQDELACNFNSNAGCADNTQCTYPGCTNPNACNYSPSAGCDDGSCSFPGCTNPTACNYNMNAGCDDGSCVFPGCTDSDACNYSPTAGCDNGSCTYPGCTNEDACNYNASAGCDDSSCTFPGCTSPNACNYNASAGCDDGSCTFPGCANPLACNYNMNAGCDDGSCTFPGCTDLSACNYDSEAGCSDDSCVYPGCTDPGANNYDPNAGCNDGSCEYDTFGCTDMMACNYNQFATEDDGSCDYSCYGCTDAEACNFDSGATIDNGSCDYSCYGCIDQEACNYDPTATLGDDSCDYSCYGCTEPDACNYDPNATIDNGSCNFDCFGCTDVTACNYDSGATIEDGSCDYSCYGCTDVNACNYEQGSTIDDGSCDYSCYGCTNADACNYDPSATINDGSCDFSCYGCTNPEACNYNPDATIDNGSCDFDCLGCTDPSACNYDSSATEDDGSCSYSCYGCTDPSACNYEVGSTIDDGSCDYSCYGCTDAEACNYDAEATISDDSCDYSCYGCTEPDACNYNPDATIDNGSCSFDCYGCTDMEACNYDAGATINDDSCDYSCYGCTDAEACNYDSDATIDNGSCDYSCYGCTDMNACNYNQGATINDGSCTYPGCTDATACNYNSNAGCSDESCVYPGCTNPDACNYNQSAGCDNGSCVFPGCTDVTACNYDVNAGCENGSCDFGCYGCTDPFALNYQPDATIDDGSCEYDENFCFFNCPDDVTVQCGDDSSPFSTGFAYYFGNCSNTSYVWSEDSEMEGNDCSYSFTRTWYGVRYVIGGAQGGDGGWVADDICTQTISVVDTEGPQFNEEPADVTVSCIDDVPAPAECLATDNCSDLITYDIFTSQTGYPTDSCVLTTAFGPGADWAVWLPDLFAAGDASSANWVFQPNGTLVAFNDGTARISGTVVNTLNPNQGFTVDFWFENKRNWTEWSALGRSYKDDLGLAAAGGNLWTTWDYYEMVNGFSTLTGFGDYAGSQLYVSHFPENYYFGFQCGWAANNKNANYGMSGWFVYEGWLNGEYVDGHGDINVDKECTEIPQLDCLHNDEFTYFWRAEDECGNVSFTDQTITVFDDIAPTIYNCPEDVSVECDEELPAVAQIGGENGIYAEDNCTGNVVITYLGESAVESEEDSDCWYQVQRTWMAEDICGNRSYCIQTITVEDTTAPVFTYVPESVTYECDEEFGFDMAMAVDNCQPEVNIWASNETIQGECPQEYTIIRTYYAEDACGNVATATQTISVVDTTAPVFDPYEIYVYIECTEVYEEDLTATDNCGEVTVTSEEILQSGGCLGVLVRTFTATDECGNSSTAVQYVVIQDTVAPVIENPADMTVECSDVPSVPEINIYDNCGYEVTVDFESWTVEGDCPDSYTIVWHWTATDYCENVSEAFTYITVVDTTDPYFLELPGDLTIECDQPVPAGEPIAAADNCDDDVLVTVIDEPAIPGECPQEYHIMRVYRAFDNCGNMTMFVQDIYVVDTTAPVFGENQSEYVYECDEVVPVITPSASDNCGEVTLVHSDNTDEGDCYTYIVRTWTATDECGNSSTFVQYITIQDTTAPVISGNVEIELPCDDYDGIFVTATDNCNEFDLTYTDEPVSGGCQGRILRTYTATDICENTSTFEQIITLTDEVAPSVEEVADFTVECGDEYEVPSPYFWDNCDSELFIVATSSVAVDGCITYETYVWTATDNCGNSTTSDVVVTIVDTTAPYFTFVPAAQEVSCDEEYMVGQATAADVCDENVTVTSSQMTLPGDCPQSWVVMITWTATDDCGNTAVAATSIYIYDNEAPVFGDNQEEFAYECDEVVPVITPSATDNCGEVTLTHTDSEDGDSCSSIIVRTWTATDECDNSSTFVQYISIMDTTAPVISGTYEIELPCDNYEGIYVSVTDNCNEWDIDYADLPVSGGCQGRILRTYTASDICGNTSEWEQLITLTDEVAPSVEEVADFTVECGDEYEVPSPYFWDNCDDQLAIVATSSVAVDGCITYETYVWTATDNCGNSTTSDVVVTIVDTTAPYFTFVPAAQEVSCDEEYMVGQATAADVCDENVTVTSSQMTLPGDCPQSWVVMITWTATDDCGNTAVAATSIYIYDNEAPVFGDNQEEFAYECDEVVPVITPSATDNCGEVTLTHTDSEDGDSCSSIIVRTWTATDECDNSSTFVQYISIMDTTAPVISGTYEIELPCDNYEGIYVSVTDNCNEWDIDYADLPVSGGCQGRILRTYTASDICGNSSSWEQLITLTDEVAPSVEEVADFTVECGDEYEVPSPYFWDNCDDQLAIVATSSVAVDGCITYETYVWTATDNCGNSTTSDVVVTIVDTTAPYFTFVPSTQEVSCDDEYSAGQATAADVCDESVTVTVSESILPGNCPQSYTVVYTWTATDDCGNSATAVSYVYIYDNVAPVFSSNPEDLYWECYSEIVPVQVSATDNCGDVTIESDVVELQSDECGNGVWEVIYYANDGCGNVSSISYYVNIYDETAPVLSETPADLVIDCDDEIPAAPEVTGTDNCGGEVEVTYVETFIGDVPAPGAAPECDLITPSISDAGNCAAAYNNTSWAMWLGSMPTMYKYYVVVDGSFEEFGDGTAHLQVTLANANNSEAGFVADVWFEGGYTWAEWDNQPFPTSFKADCGGVDANYQDWTYYLMSNGTLTGWGDYEGSFITLTHAPSNHYFGYQVGLGANNLTSGYGSGGWFEYTGTFLVDGEPVFSGSTVGGAGDFAFEHDCCPDYYVVRTWCATDCTGNTTCWTQEITFADLDGDNGNGGVAPGEEAQTPVVEGDFDFVTVKPNPARDITSISFTSKVTNTLTMEVYDASGRRIAELFRGNVQPDVVYNVNYDTNILEDGIYTIRLFSLSEQKATRLMVTK